MGHVLKTDLLGLINTVNIAELDRLAFCWFELRLGRAGFHKTSVLEEHR